MGFQGKDLGIESAIHEFSLIHRLIGFVRNAQSTFMKMQNSLNRPLNYVMKTRLTA